MRFAEGAPFLETLINGVPTDIGQAYLQVDGATVASTFTYGTVTQFSATSAGTHSLRALDELGYAVGPLKTPALSAGGRYTLALVGAYPNYRVLAFAEPSGDGAQLSLYEASPSIPRRRLRQLQRVELLESQTVGQREVRQRRDGVAGQGRLKHRRLCWDDVLPKAPAAAAQLPNARADQFVRLAQRSAVSRSISPLALPLRRQERQRERARLWESWIDETLATLRIRPGRRRDRGGCRGLRRPSGPAPIGLSHPPMPTDTPAAHRLYVDHNGTLYEYALPLAAESKPERTLQEWPGLAVAPAIAVEPYGNVALASTEAIRIFQPPIVSFAPSHVKLSIKLTPAITEVGPFGADLVDMSTIRTITCGCSTTSALRSRSCAHRSRKIALPR